MRLFTDGLSVVIGDLETFRFIISTTDHVEESDELEFLDALPEGALRHVASFLTAEEILSKLLVACPGLAPELRNGVDKSSWDERMMNMSFLDELRCMMLSQVGSVKHVTIKFRPEKEFLLKKLKRILASNLRTLSTSPRFIAGIPLSTSITELIFCLSSVDFDQDSFALLSPDDMPPYSPNRRIVLDADTYPLPDSGSLFKLFP